MMNVIIKMAFLPYTNSSEHKNINLYVNLRSVCAMQLLKFVLPSLLFPLVDTCARKKLIKFHLTVKIDSAELVY